MKIMKAIFQILFLLFITTNSYAEINTASFSCPKELNCTDSNILVTAISQGSIYLNGIYTGKKTPNMVSLSNGEHVISVGLEHERQYLKKTVNILNQSKTTIHFTEKDKQKPSLWKALFVGVPTAYGESAKGKCSTNFSQQDLDVAYDFFKLNMKEHIEPFSYNTVEWKIDRRDLTKPVELTHNENNGWYTLEAEQGLAELDNVQPGEYDTVFLFWREEESGCSFKSSYFGLAWLEPTSDEARKTGYVTVKFNPGKMGVAARIQQYLAEDPGVWTHEWLHVVIENFYPNLQVKTPIPPKDKLILHAAGAYGYKYPWLDWYKDLISGQVPLGQGYSGIGPEALLSCSVSRHALKQCVD
jgi:hypothetical protein